MKVIFDIPGFDEQDLAALQETLRRRPAGITWGADLVGERDALPVRSAEAVENEDNKGLIWVEGITPDVRLAIDSGGSLVLVTTPGRQGPRWPLGRMEGLLNAALNAHAAVKAHRAVKYAPPGFPVAAVDQETLLNRIH